MQGQRFGVYCVSPVGLDGMGGFIVCPYITVICPHCTTISTCEPRQDTMLQSVHWLSMQQYSVQQLPTTIWVPAAPPPAAELTYNPQESQPVFIASIYTPAADNNPHYMSMPASNFNCGQPPVEEPRSPEITQYEQTTKYISYKYKQRDDPKRKQWRKNRPDTTTVVKALEAIQRQPPEEDQDCFVVDEQAALPSDVNYSTPQQHPLDKLLDPHDTETWANKVHFIDVTPSPIATETAEVERSLSPLFPPVDAIQEIIGRLETYRANISMPTVLLAPPQPGEQDFSCTETLSDIEDTYNDASQSSESNQSTPAQSPDTTKRKRKRKHRVIPLRLPPLRRSTRSAIASEN